MSPEDDLRGACLGLGASAADAGAGSVAGAGWLGAGDGALKLEALEKVAVG